MFMQIAIGAIGIGVILMIGYIVISQVKSALPATNTVQIANECYGQVGIDPNTGTCVNNTAGVWTFLNCGSTEVTDSLNLTAIVDCPNVGATAGTASVQTTIFAGFGLIAVGIIVLAAFGLINIFK